MTTAASGIGGVLTTASAATTTAKVADLRCRRIFVCRLAGAAPANARPAAAAGICIGICPKVTRVLAARLTWLARKTGSLRPTAGLSCRIIPGAAASAISTAASTGCGYTAKSIA